MTLPRLRPALIVGPIALAAAALAFWTRAARRARWHDEVVGTHCRLVPPLPDVTAVTVLAIVAAALAAACFALACRVLANRSPRPLLILAAVLCALAVGGVVTGVFFLISAPTDPYGGLDGSGLPCGSG
ncbi:hypothetical protein ACFYTQ_18225 [Nocardia sp. NPDC004068]|uniref:hypothetical protein n=1 Tax=Nocardia sp. NPDC004068 TaxID=3364303 RepID=UPI0036C45D6A